MPDSKIISFTILGDIPSKSNSRRLILNKRTKKPMIIKSAKALQYVQDFGKQCPRLRQPLKGDVSLLVNVIHRDRRRDVDIALLQDCLQKAGIVENDRQIRNIEILGAEIDRENPRAEISLVEI